MEYLDEYEDIIDSIDRGDINEEWLYHDDEYVRYALAEIIIDLTFSFTMTKN